MHKGFNLTELIIVIVVLGVLVMMAMPGYWGVRQRTQDREAQAMLRLIQAVERTRQLETGEFVGCENTPACNNALNLDLPTGSWQYSVILLQNGGDFCAEATYSDRSWHINRGSQEAETGPC